MFINKNKGEDIMKTMEEMSRLYFNRGAWGELFKKIIIQSKGGKEVIRVELPPDANCIEEKLLTPFISDKLSIPVEELSVNDKFLIHRPK